MSANEPVDVMAKQLARDDLYKERMINLETMNVLREKVRQCFRREGVNHHEHCKKETDAYFRMLMKRDTNPLTV